MDATSAATTLSNEQFIAEDGAVGFNGYRGYVILIGKHKNSTDQNERVAYGWGCNKDGNIPTYKASSDNWSSEYVDTSSSNKAYKKPVRVQCSTLEEYPFKVWCICGQQGDNYDSLHFQTYMNVGANERTQKFYGCGWNEHKQISQNVNNQTVSSLQGQIKSEAYRGTAMPKAIDIQGTSCGSVIFGLFQTQLGSKTENGKEVGEIWACGYYKSNMGATYESNISNGATVWTQFIKQQTVSKLWFYSDTNPNNNPKDHGNYILYFESEGTATKLGVAGYDPVYAEQGSFIYTVSGCEFIDDGKQWVDISLGLSISSAATNSAWNGALIYGVTPDKRRIVLKGGDPNTATYSVVQFPHKKFIPLEGMPEIAM